LRRVDVDTFFWPVIQAGVLGVKEEEKGLGRVWEAVDQSFVQEPKEIQSGYGGVESLSTNLGETSTTTTANEVKVPEKERPVARGVQVDLTSGYFGLYDAYKRMVIDSPAPVRVIAASPKVSPLLLHS
jgi:CDP-diacylglycerol--glycerol-3-phosphate 3-phosphatidyltransferase